jgi:hypothetical protein
LAAQFTAETAGAQAGIDELVDTEVEQRQSGAD